MKTLIAVIGLALLAGAATFPVSASSATTDTVVTENACDHMFSELMRRHCWVGNAELKRYGGGAVEVIGHRHMHL